MFIPSSNQEKRKPGVISHIQRNVFGTQQIYIGFDFEIKANEVGGIKVKEYRNRPGVAQRVPGGLGSQIFMTFGT
jgi:hypothetical protein